MVENQIIISKLSEYERFLRSFLSVKYNNDYLKNKFDLLPKYASFCREYAICKNAKKSAIYSGFSKKTASHSVSRILKKCSSALSEINIELDLKRNEYKIALREHLTIALLDIVANRNNAPAPAVIACKQLCEMYNLYDLNNQSINKEVSNFVSIEDIKEQTKILKNLCENV